MAKHSFTFKFSATLLLVLTALVVQSCMSRGTDEASLYNPPKVNMNHVTYSDVRQDILIPQCIKCHSEFATEQGVAAQMIPGDPAHSPLYLKVADGEMPKNGTPLPNTMVQMIKAYIEQAAGSPNPTPTDPPIDLKHVDYDVLYNYIFGPRCLKCHDEFANEEGVLGDVTPGDPDHSILYNYVAEGRMPKDGVRLDTNYVAAIKTYIENLPKPDYPPIEPSWTSINANLIQQSCIQCHSDGGRAEKVPFETYDEVVHYAKKIAKKIQDTKRPMPPARTTLPASPELVKAFINWMNAGEPQN